MSEQPTVHIDTPAESITPIATTPGLSKAAERNRNLSFVVGLCSVAVIGCFFLPWANFLFAKPSGYDLTQMPDDDMAKCLWSIPLVSLMALLAVITKKVVSLTACIAGALPFLALLYYGAKAGQDLFRVLDFGAYFTLCLGAALVLLPCFFKKPQS